MWHLEVDYKLKKNRLETGAGMGGKGVHRKDKLLFMSLIMITLEVPLLLAI